jgi:mannosyltransferase
MTRDQRRRARNAQAAERRSSLQVISRSTLHASRLTSLLPCVILALAFVLRAANITAESLWRDEVDTIRFAFAPLSELLANLTRNGFNGPFYHLLMRAWLSLGGTNDFTLRYFSLLCGVAGVTLVYALARRLFGRGPALIAMALATIAPVLIWYSGEGKMYTLQPALLVLALYALRRAVEKRGKEEKRKEGKLMPRFSFLDARFWLPWWLVFVVAISLGYYTHLLTPLFLVVAAVFFVAWWRRSRHHLVGAGVALALCTLPYVPMALWQLPALLSGGDTGHAFYTLDVMLYSLFFNWSIGLNGELPPGVPPQFVWLCLAAFVGLAAVGVFGAPLPRRSAEAGRAVLRPRASALAVLAWLLLPALMIYAISTRAPVFEPRYVLWSAPALYILVGVGLAWLWSRLPLVTLALAALLAATSLWGFVAQLTYPIRPDIRGAAQFVAQDMQPGDLFVFQIPYTRYGFEYYLPRFAPQLPLEPSGVPDDGLVTLQGLRARIVDAPFTNYGMTLEALDAPLAPVKARSQRIWLVESEAPMWDTRGLVRAWFDGHMPLAERRELRGVTVSLYALRLENKSFLPVFLGQIQPAP